MDVLVWVVPIIILIVFAIITELETRNFTQPGKKLAQKFDGLAPIVGKSRQQIIASVGEPSGVSTMLDKTFLESQTLDTTLLQTMLHKTFLEWQMLDKTLLQWQATGYSIELLFDGDVCESVLSEVRMFNIKLLHGKKLSQKFDSLAPIVGKSRQQIIASVGEPSGVSTMFDKTLLQWQATGYSIGLLFDGDVCESVLSELRIFNIKTQSGKKLSQKFDSLAPIVGKSRQQIIASVGKPSGVDTMLDHTRLEWQATGYHIVLLFDGDVCKSIDRRIP